MKPIIGKKYIDLSSKDIIEVTDIYRDRIGFKTIKDPNKVWQGQKGLTIRLIEFHEWYVLDKVYTTPLYKLLNEK